MRQTTESMTNAFSEYQQWLRKRQLQLEGTYQLSQCEWSLSQDEGVVTYRRGGDHSRNCDVQHDWVVLCGQRHMAVGLGQSCHRSCAFHPP